jgi:hypothetical protein
LDADQVRVAVWSVEIGDGDTEIETTGVAAFTVSVADAALEPPALPHVTV